MTVKMEGFRELERSLAELPKAAAKATLQRVLKKAAAPVQAAMREKAPKLTGQLERSIVTGTRLTRRQAQAAKKEGKAFSEIYIGTANPAGVPQEFGTVKAQAQPFARPAWEETQDEALAIISTELGAEIEKSAVRLGRKTAGLARG
jgi:HK97 gp10 family phage protein